MSVSSETGVSHFSDTALRQIEGVYGARTIADTGELHLWGDKTERWNVSLPVSIEYQESHHGVFDSDDGVLVCCVVDYGLVASYLTES